MRNLREKLMAVSSKPVAARSTAPPPAEPFFCRETVTPLAGLRGIEQTTLEEIRAVDPRFTGAAWDMSRVLFLDTETTGLSGGAGTVAFEIGVGFLTDRGLVIRQYVMRDYGEEAAMLAEIAALLRRYDTLVTFNGKSFDLPLLESRLIMARIRLPVTQMPHLDLLHAARRVYRLRLGRCNLAALEEAVLGVHREDDLPGVQVPQRYFDYIKTREFALLEDVLRHNLEDVRSLASLTAVLCAAFRSPQTLSHPEDLFGVGRTLMRGGQTERARSCFRILGHSTLAPQAQLHLAISYKRDKDWAQTIQTCQEMIAGGAGGVWPYLELAKYYEHVARDLPRALRYATGALSYTLNTAPLWGADERQTGQIRNRITRLKRKMNRKEKNI